MEKKTHKNNNKNKTEMEFGVRIATHSILKQLNNGGHQTNLVLSPLSLHICLNLLAAGAKGPTLDQLLRFLNAENVAQLNAQSSLLMDLASPEPDSPHGSPMDEDPGPEPELDLLDGDPMDESTDETPSSGGTNQQLNDLPSLFSTRSHMRQAFGINPFPTKSGSAFETPSRKKGPIVSMVNGIWVDQRFSLKHSFKLVADDVYKAGCESVDFNKAEQVANEINAWAKEASKGHIDDVVSSGSLKGAALVLANALYFKGTWVKKFEPSDTEVEDFRLLEGKQVRVPFMKKRRTISYYKSMNGFQILKMEYKTGEDNTNYAMHIFLPDRHDGLPELVQKFHSDPGFFTQNHGLQDVELRKLWLPKLKFDYVFDVAENIKELGLDLPFKRKAELTEIVDEEDDIYVSNVSQKSYIEVNEEGTVATSVTYVTGMVFGLGRVTSPPLIDFVADHPFLFMIKEEISGTVLFVGAALNPLQ